MTHKSFSLITDVNGKLCTIHNDDLLKSLTENKFMVFDRTLEQLSKMVEFWDVNKHTAAELSKVKEINGELVEACADALDQLEALAAHKDTNPWCQQLRAALSNAASTNPDTEGGNVMSDSKWADEIAQEVVGDSHTPAYWRKDDVALALIDRDTLARKEERERCAVIAEKLHAGATIPDTIWWTQTKTGEAIAAAIRNQSS